MATVHLIDDDASLRTALARLLSAAGYEVRSYAAAGDYLVPDPDDEPGCLLLDLLLPGTSGLELQAALRRHPAYERPIVFLSGAADVPASVQAMRAGAREFLTKPVDGDRLLAAIKDAVEYDNVLRAQRKRVRLARAQIESLNEREHKVLNGIVAGKLNKQIAADLRVCERTVKGDRASIMRHLGVRTLLDLLKRVIEANHPEDEDPVARRPSPGH
jgi:FixJ family two-component response regulator